jgi:2-C-methyl-D-erythritol 2,4-cyclodiphosphate synthase/2-C-methyl-D-erythritol 4-phosphate cytidylyltransferase
MRGEVPDKVLAGLGGRPVFAWSLDSFAAAGSFAPWVVVWRDEAQRRALAELVAAAGVPEVIWVQGGVERTDSVRNALAVLPAGVERVVIHDCARPLVSVAAIRRLQAALAHGPAASLARPLTDTVKELPAGVDATAPQHLRTLDRGRLWTVETPQGFAVDLLRRAHAALAGKVTDDAAAVEALGEPVQLVENPDPNPKITRPGDLTRIAAMLAPAAAAVRVGHGYDIHRSTAGRRLVLGGVEIPADFGLAGHSDADALTHALADAILGAAGLADIGHYFPNDDPAIAGIDSQQILARAVQEAGRRGWQVGNIDATIIAERPRLGPHIPAMRQRLAATLGIDGACIGIKATTAEGIGGLGRGEGIAAYAVVLLHRAAAGS